MYEYWVLLSLGVRLVMLRLWWLLELWVLLWFRSWLLAPGLECSVLSRLWLRLNRPWIGSPPGCCCWLGKDPDDESDETEVERL